MKNAQKIVAGAFAVSALSAMANGALAQTSVASSASGSVSIITPLTMSKSTDLAFGTILRPASSGTVAIDTAGNRSFGTGVTGTTATFTRASFVITGEGGVAVPLSIGALTMTGAGTIPVTLTPTGSSSLTLATVAGAATLTLGIGGLITVSSTQASGAYSGTFTVSVNYN